MLCPTTDIFKNVKITIFFQYDWGRGDKLSQLCFTCFYYFKFRDNLSVLGINIFALKKR